jgi:hypothetical protein
VVLRRAEEEDRHIVIPVEQMSFILLDIQVALGVRKLASIVRLRANLPLSLQDNPRPNQLAYLPRNQ